MTGVDDQGRSCIKEAGEVAFANVSAGLELGHLFATTDSPPRPIDTGRDAIVDLGVGPGRCTWALWQFAANAEVSVHRTETVDFDVLVRGAVEIVLDDGPHALEPGDCIVVTGVDHGWRAGPDGCVISALNLGTAALPPSSG